MQYIPPWLCPCSKQSCFYKSTVMHVKFFPNVVLGAKGSTGMLIIVYYFYTEGILKWHGMIINPVSLFWPFCMISLWPLDGSVPLQSTVAVGNKRIYCRSTNQTRLSQDWTLSYDLTPSLSLFVSITLWYSGVLIFRLMILWCIDIQVTDTLYSIDVPACLGLSDKGREQQLLREQISVLLYWAPQNSNSCCGTSIWSKQFTALSLWFPVLLEIHTAHKSPFSLSLGINSVVVSWWKIFQYQ